MSKNSFVHMVPKIVRSSFVAFVKGCQDGAPPSKALGKWDLWEGKNLVVRLAFYFAPPLEVTFLNCCIYFFLEGWLFHITFRVVDGNPHVFVMFKQGPDMHRKHPVLSLTMCCS